MKRLLVTVLFLALAANVFAYPDKPTLGFSQVNWGWSDSEGKSRPVAVDASGAVLITGTMSATISTISAALIGGTATVGSIGAIVNPLPTGTNTIGSIGAIINALPAGTNQIGSIGAIVNPLPAGTNTLGSVTVITLPALPAGSNVIGTVVASNTPIATGNSLTLNTSTVATDIPAVAGRVWVFIQNTGTETVYIQPFSDVASPTFSGGASYVLLQYDTITFDFGEEVAIGHVSSTAGTIKVTQGVPR